ncbi:argonaute-like protein [Punctularia strigosozonata HHB-11173 SS5]|uniref:argonaute-like protein n=1 Tax=Punctularia strigosozonata (strain HHB-11173) TaxID=741275 RepID=UPI000441700C|nr:argonaute-like protein [Punctularia strigosozonata HHB-11173 SS5]EIN06816.1 argonaute-like protein [Punctularia strigosozonata HHB-11173 SS5]
MSGRGNRGARGGGGGGRGSPRGASPARGGPRGASPAGGASPHRGGPPGDRGGGRGRGGPGGGGRGGPGGFRGGGRGGPAQVFMAGRPATIDQHIAGSEQLVQRFKTVPPTAERPLRPGFGTLGTPVTLRANFFRMTLPKGAKYYDYVIEVKPNVAKGKVRRVVEIMLAAPAFATYRPRVAHDGMQRMITPRALPQPLEIPVEYYDEAAAGPKPGAPRYTVEIRLERELDMNQLTKYTDGDLDARNLDIAPYTAALNLVLQQYASDTAWRVGRNRHFFPSDDEKRSLGMGVEALRGFFSSVRPVYKQLMVNVNVCMTAFYEPSNLADAIMAFNRQSRGGMPKAFKDKLRVRTLHLGHKKPVKAIGTKSASQTFFNCEELGGRISVADYFRRKYPHLPLRHADDLPVVDIAGPARREPVWIPAELCEITEGTPYSGRLSDRETADMIRYACRPPYENAQTTVDEGLPKLGLVPRHSTLTAFGIEISGDMTTIPARVLPPPRLSYRSGQPNVRDGAWNILDVKFHRGGDMTNWAVLIVQEQGQGRFSGPNDQTLLDLVTGFANKCRKAGMTVPQALPKIIATPNLPDASNDSFRASAIEIIRTTIVKNLDPKKKPSFILVLLSRIDNYIYPGIKRLGDVVLGVHTTCMLLDKVLGTSYKPKTPQQQDQYFSNVALKVNTKLGGINHLLDANAMAWLKEKKTMVVGMDVTHPGPRSVWGTPSVAAVVASVDENCVQFPASLRLQETRKEMITALDEMMIERLQAYQRSNKQALPERIFVYRDGVSEGQYDTVLVEEYPLILKSFERISPNKPYRPSLSIIICGKRHHARFNGTVLSDVDQGGNTKPGTVVDKGVTDPYLFDFYLQAHKGLQGTVKATHYAVIYDENRLTADGIQKGTHDASYSYARATKAVSLIPAAYYADIACERGRYYINDFLNLGDEKSSVAPSTAGGRRTREEEKQRVFDEATARWGNGVHPDLRGSMFYI